MLHASACILQPLVAFWSRVIYGALWIYQFVLSYLVLSVLQIREASCMLQHWSASDVVLCDYVIVQLHVIVQLQHSLHL
jgi:hypothetical protein